MDDWEDLLQLILSIAGRGGGVIGKICYNYQIVKFRVVGNFME